MTWLLSWQSPHAWLLSSSEGTNVSSHRPCHPPAVSTPPAPSIPLKPSNATGCFGVVGSVFGGLLDVTPGIRAGTTPFPDLPVPSPGRFSALTSCLPPFPVEDSA